MSESVGIVVVNWNGIVETRRCVRSLLRLRGASVRIVVVDNASTDGSASALRAEFPDVAVVELPANLGYAAAANAGIRWARDNALTYVWLLNNDTLVDPGALEAFVAAARRIGGACILAPRIVTGEEGADTWSAGGSLRWPWMERVQRGVDVRAEPCGEMERVDWASGCSLFFPLSTVDQTGPLDERYFLYLEDVDWCRTARRHGVGTWYVPEARVWHAVSRSVGAVDGRILRYYACRNYYMLVFRHGGLIGRAWAAGRLAITLAKVGVRLAISPAARRDQEYAAQTRALLDVLRRRVGRAPYAHEVGAGAGGLVVAEV